MSAPDEWDRAEFRLKREYDIAANLDRRDRLAPPSYADWVEDGCKPGGLPAGATRIPPGMLLAAYDFLQVNPAPSEAEIRECLAAVLSRCTGYQGIVRAVQAAAERLRG